ncbi:YgaP family membrane protein [Actibacterium sp. D379-3]
MFKKNVGTTDRVIRIVVGLALIAGFFLNAEASLRWLYLIGIIPLVTGIFATCPVYSIFGFKTCPMSDTPE